MSSAAAAYRASDGLTLAAVRTTTNTCGGKRHWLDQVVNLGVGGVAESTFAYTRRADGQVTPVEESVRQPNAALSARRPSTSATGWPG